MQINTYRHMYIHKCIYIRDVSTDMYINIHIFIQTYVHIYIHPHVQLHIHVQCTEKHAAVLQESMHTTFMDLSTHLPVDLYIYGHRYVYTHIYTYR